MINEINLNEFYPDYMKIEEAKISEKDIHITMRSITKTSTCPVCRQVSTKRHTFYNRTVKDLPILGKPVNLLIASRMYYCTNEQCEVITFNEYLRDFIGVRKYYTERCEAFIMAISLNTSCEAASLICKQAGIDISGDTAIRILLRNTREIPYNGEYIGVDDWAYRKGQTYGTLICDLLTSKPIALFPGRDGAALKTWLQHNKQVKLITRDRASAYAAAIQEVLPEAVQIADRFHLFQNLLKAVNDAIRTVIPTHIQIYNELPEPINEEHIISPAKKNVI